MIVVTNWSDLLSMNNSNKIYELVRVLELVLNKNYSFYLYMCYIQ